MTRTFIEHAAHLVAITSDTNYTTYYFKDKEKSTSFFFNKCLNNGIVMQPMKPRHTWAREQAGQLTIDFETIVPMTLHSIFELQ